MNKPFTLQVQETEEQIVKALNEAKLPAYVLKNILKEVYDTIQQIDNEEVKKYKEESNEEKENDK